MDDMVRKKKKKVKNKKFDTSLYDFCTALQYSKMHFGMGDDIVDIYVLDSSVSDLKSNFQIFEDMSRVEHWPVSMLIQRELNHQRASLICHDYLLSDGGTKFFPPLIAVLIPTDANFFPCDEYENVTEDDLEALQKIVILPRKDEFEEYEDPVALAKGVYTIPFDDGEEGYVTWDKRCVSAVIIDGQHRYKALKEAANTNKNFESCKLIVTLIDLTTICSKKNIPPSEVSRDLFVTINNTPEEVSESRLVLMDDRDAISTFTQTIVDDRNGSESGVPPELIDWDCDGGKHDNTQSLTGVLTLRQIIQTAMFDNKSLSSIDERSKQKLVRKWIDNMELWLNPDPIIEKQLSKNATLYGRYEIACNNIADDDEDDSNLFLFSYSSEAAKIIKRRFSDLYLASFKYVFMGLLPYSQLNSLAEEHNVTIGKGEIRTYYRSFSGRRKEIENSGEIKGELNTYKKKFKRITQNHLLHTVMGQKSVFSALFEGYISQKDDDATSDDILACAKSFTKEFNNVYDKLHPSDNHDEFFFGVNYRLKSTRKVVTESGNLGKDFWHGIIRKFNGEIDYGITAVKLLKSIIIDIIDYDPGEEDEKFKFTMRKEIIKRHRNILRKINDELEEEDAEEIAVKLVKFKESIMKKRLA